MLNYEEKVKREEELKKLSRGECLARVSESLEGFDGEMDPVKVNVRDYIYGEWYSIFVENEDEYIMAIKMLWNNMYHYRTYEMEVEVIKGGVVLCAYNVEDEFIEDWQYKARVVKE